MTFQQELDCYAFVRLRHLQTLYCDGEIMRGSPEHFEILALEELESLRVREEKRRHHAAERYLSCRYPQRRGATHVCTRAAGSDQCQITDTSPRGEFHCLNMNSLLFIFFLASISREEPGAALRA